MHPLHEYVARQVAGKLNGRRVVVWYDQRREFVPFVGELREAPGEPNGLMPVTIGGVPAWLAEYSGSMFALRALVEPYVSTDTPDNVVIYLPGCKRDNEESALMELEKAGEVYEPQLKRLARNVLRNQYTDGVIDEMLAREGVSYEDLARTASAQDAPSLLKLAFHDTAGPEALLATWLASDAQDADIQSKEALAELRQLVRSRLGLELPPDALLPKLRAITLRYVLAGEFRSDLKGVAPSNLEAVPAPKTKDEESGLRELARRLRADHAEAYSELADRVEQELGLAGAPVDAAALGSIDTFRFEERALLSYCGDLIARSLFAEAGQLISEREHSFWLDRDVERKAQWEACRRMAEVGLRALEVKAQLGQVSGGVGGWIEAYTANGGWFGLDQAQRRLEVWLTTLQHDPEERPLGVVRRAYEDVCDLMVTGFTKALVTASWTTKDSMPQTHVYEQVVAAQPKPVAYFLVDAMRYEMGVELAERLPESAEVHLSHAIGALPSITQVGMAALQPGAAASFSVVEQGGRLGARINGSFLPDVTARRRLAAAGVPALVDMTLDELLMSPARKLSAKVERSSVIIVRSQEIDSAGEGGFAMQARQAMDNVIDNLARAIRKLADAGVRHAVVSADHGHLFFPFDRDEAMRIDAPGGAQVELHRRCWVGRGGATPPGCIRVPAAALGYESDLEFVFPLGSGVFKAGGDLAYHHGGPSLEEMVVPVITVRAPDQESTRPAGDRVTVTDLPDVVTNRIFTIGLQAGGQNLALFPAPRVVRPLLTSAGRQVGSAGMAIDAVLDEGTGCVTLEPGRPATVAFRLSDESAESLRVVIQDPATDAELYRSPSDIPVDLGVA